MAEIKTEPLQVAIDQVVTEVRTGLLALTNDTDPNRYNFNRWIDGASDDKVYEPAMEQLGIHTTGVAKTEAGKSDKLKTEWLATSNPNVYVVQKSGTEDGQNWQINSRRILVAGYDFLATEGLK